MTSVPAPEHFFAAILPALARERARAFPALATRICVVVDGPTTHRAWTLALHDGVVTPGGDPAAPFQLYLSASAFARLLDGTLDGAALDDAIAKKHVGYRGDLRVLEQLGRMLAGSSSAVDVRGR